QQARAAAIEVQLAEARLHARQAFRVVILIAGVDGGGKGDTLNTLNEWMDPRHLQTNAIRPVNEGLEGRPPMWQFWRALPKKGGLAVFVRRARAHARRRRDRRAARRAGAQQEGCPRGVRAAAAGRCTRSCRRLAGMRT
ncbi:MAG TPA: hypothetical protein VHT91_47920, partial [Kofleriaceae bacterium]|nr:hypothetical protein [Kofleriaceae bacterium]